MRLKKQQASRFLAAIGIDSDAAFARLKEQIAKHDEAAKVKP